MNTTITHYFKFSHYFQHVGIISGCLLIFLALGLLFPFSTVSSSATTYPIDTNQSIAVALDEEAVMDITPSSTGTKGSSTTRLKVSSNRSSGYKVYLSTMDSTNAMVNVSDSTKPSIQALPTSSTKADFAANTWGYALTTTEANDSTTFSAVPTTSTMVADRPAKDEDNLYLTFAASIDTSLPAGQYANSVLVSVVANPLAITDLTNMIYMQDMQPEFCANTKGANGLATVTPGNEVEKRLIDVRDGKEYWVSKLADQNCWMTQNLALDLNEKTLPLKPETSDVSREWGPNKNTENGIPTTDNTDLDGTGSWNVGDYVYATPLKGEYCPKQTSGGYMADAAKAGETIEHCQDFPKVTDWSDNLTVGIGTWNGQNLSYVAANAERKTYDAHYKMGNFYQWNTAVAGSGTGLSSPENAKNDADALLNATESICPRGWRLPREQYNLTSGLPSAKNDFWNLIGNYGYLEKDLDIVSTDGGTSISSVVIDTKGDSEANIFRLPIGITDAGWMYIETQFEYAAFRQVGEVGLYWSSTAHIDNKSSFALSTTLKTGRVAPMAWSGKTSGLNVRCLVR